MGSQWNLEPVGSELNFSHKQQLCKSFTPSAPGFPVCEMCGIMSVSRAVGRIRWWSGSTVHGTRRSQMQGREARELYLTALGLQWHQLGGPHLCPDVSICRGSALFTESSVHGGHPVEPVPSSPAHRATGNQTRGLFPAPWSSWSN